MFEQRNYFGSLCSNSGKHPALYYPHPSHQLLRCPLVHLAVATLAPCGFWNTPGTLSLWGICILHSLCLEFSVLRPTWLVASLPPSQISPSPWSLPWLPYVKLHSTSRLTPLYLFCLSFPLGHMSPSSILYAYLFFPVCPLPLKYMLQEVRDVDCLAHWHIQGQEIICWYICWGCGEFTVIVHADGARMRETLTLMSSYYVP